MPIFRRERLDHIMVHVSERLSGKLGNANNNAFKLRKLFKMYDAAGTGKASLPLHQPCLLWQAGSPNADACRGFI